jgi:hypothetical protein
MVMSKVEKKSLSFFSTNNDSTKSKPFIPPKQLISDNNNEQKHLDSSDLNANKTMPVDSEDQETDSDWETVGAKKLQKFRKTKTKVSSINNTQLQPIIHQTTQADGVHSYFSFGKSPPMIKPRSNQNKSEGLPRTGIRHSIPTPMNDNLTERNKNSFLPPFKIQFVDQQKPPEI